MGMRVKASGASEQSSGWEFVFSRDKADFDALSYGGGDATEHFEGMAGVVGVLERADHGFGCANHLGEAGLGQAGFFAQLVDFSGKLILGACFFELGNPLRLAAVISAMQDFNCVGSGFFVFR